MEVHVGENDQVVEAAVGDAVILALPENGGTGYRWNVEVAGDELALESDEFAPPESAAPGAAGRRVITLRARRAGTTRVDVHLRREWETTAAERRDLAITVRA